MTESKLNKILCAKRESKHLDFKEKLSIDQSQDWCEIIKDIVAMANSGGGCILIGAKNDGTPSGADVCSVLNLDPALVTDKIAKYTGEQYADFDIKEIEKNGYRLAALLISSISIPMIFVLPGTYDIGDGKQKTAFGKGTIYFRHGAKSEPGNTKDLRECIEREIEKIRKSWLGNVRKVIEAPHGYSINVLPPEVVESSLLTATPIRIVNDPKVAAYRKIEPDKTHPYRQTDVVQLMNQRLDGKKSITPYDVKCIRKVYKISEKSNFYYKSKFASPQYSDDFVDFLTNQFENDESFFEKARNKVKDEITQQV